MKKQNCLLVMLLLLSLVLNPFSSVMAQKPAGTAQDTLTNNPSSDPDTDKPLARKAAPPKVVFAQAITNEQLAKLIESIMAQLGFPPGVRVIVLPPGSTDPTPTPTPTPTTPAPTPQPTPPTPTPTPTTNGLVKASDELRQTLQTKYGITAVNGNIWWSERQIKAADAVLARLPKSFRSNTTEIKRDTDIPYSLAPGMQGRVSGYVRSDIPGRVHMLNPAATGANLQDAINNFQGVMVHEMTHCFQFKHPDVYQAWAQQFWSSGRPNPGSVSGYGNTQPAEDFSESVRVYYQAGARMKAAQPGRYNFIKQYVMDGQEF